MTASARPFITAFSNLRISYDLTTDHNLLKSSYYFMMLTLSPLPKTWILDVDGTLVVHNGYLTPEGDRLLPGVKSFFASIPSTDLVVLITARPEEHKEALVQFLKQEGIRFDCLILNAPTGERILVNDAKPSGLRTAYAYSATRNGKFDLKFHIDSLL